jgi:hypothetical protein
LKMSALEELGPFGWKQSRFTEVAGRGTRAGLSGRGEFAHNIHGGQRAARRRRGLRRLYFALSPGQSRYGR